MMDEWIDYYEILQVHPEAEPEVIQAAYKRLSRKYHPDVNRDHSAEERMKWINVAYKVLSNPEQRRQYDGEWQLKNERNASGSSVKEQYETWNTHPAADSAYCALREYFQSLLDQAYPMAYRKLALNDQRQITLEDFRNWKEAVAGVYRLGSFEIKPFRRYLDCQIGEYVFEEIREYSVHTRDRNLKTRQMNEEDLTKYVVFQNGRWYVFLGYKDLKPLIFKFKCLAEAEPELNPDHVFAETVLKFDQLTGLKNRKGFLEEIEQEVFRNKRYGNPFTVAVINILPTRTGAGAPPMDYENLCLLQGARIVKQHIRNTDRVGRWSHNGLVILFTETTQGDARQAVDKLHSQLQNSMELRFESYAGVAEYRGDLREALLTAESDANLKTVSYDAKQITAIMITDQPV